MMEDCLEKGCDTLKGRFPLFGSRKVFVRISGKIAIGISAVIEIGRTLVIFVVWMINAYLNNRPGNFLVQCSGSITLADFIR